jgi:hypothetical protein
MRDRCFPDNKETLAGHVERLESKWEFFEMKM